MKKNKGFTLIEIMIALFIFAIIATIITAALHTVITAHRRTEAYAKQLQNLQVTITLLQNDITQIIDRPITNAKGTKLPAVMGDSSKHYLEFTCGGFNNPLSQEKRSNLARAAYNLKKGKLIRIVWPVLDRAPKTKANKRILLTNILNLQISFFANNKWQKIWPTKDSTKKNSLPKAIKISLNIAGKGKISRIFIISGENFAQN